MTAHLGDVILTVLVLALGGLIIQSSMYDESFFGFDDFAGVLYDMHSGNFEREHAHIVILDNPSAIVFFEGKQNLIYNYNRLSNIKYLDNYGGNIEIAVPNSCEKNCLCYMTDFDVTRRGSYTTLSEDRAVCYNDVGFNIEFTGEYGEKEIYSLQHGWLIERGLAILATDNDEVYEISVDDNSKGAAINNQIMARRRTVYLSLDKETGTVHVFQYKKRTEDGDYTDITSQSTEYDFVPGEIGGTDHDKQMMKFN